VVPGRPILLAQVREARMRNDVLGVYERLPRAAPVRCLPPTPRPTCRAGLVDAGRPGWFEIVFVHVRVHPDSLAERNLVGFRTRSGVRKNHFQDVDRPARALMISMSRRIEAFEFGGKPRM